MCGGVSHAVMTDKAGGFATLWPFRFLEDESLREQGVEPHGSRSAHGFAIVTSKGDAIRLRAGNLEDARQAAFFATATGPVDIFEAIAIGKNDQIVFERRERLRIVKGEINPYSALFVGEEGQVFKAVKNPRNPHEFDAEIEKLAAKDSAIDRKFLFPAVGAYVVALSRKDWASMTQSQVDSTLRRADRAFEQAVKKNATKATPAWAKATDTSAQNVGRRAFHSVREEYYPSVGVSWDLPNTQAINRISVQGGFWLRNNAGVRSQRLTAQARTIIERGMKDGLGRDSIAKDLQAQLGRMWTKGGLNYARVNAAVALNRARSYSEIKSYLSAGIEWLEIKAVIDESTTEICRALDGQVISAPECDAINEAAANVKVPEMIKTVNPFLREVRDPKTGLINIQTRTGVKFAEVVRSSGGVRDQKGQYRYFKMGTQMAPDGVGTPPYHEL